MSVSHRSAALRLSAAPQFDSSQSEVQSRDGSFWERPPPPFHPSPKPSKHVRRTGRQVDFLTVCRTVHDKNRLSKAIKPPHTHTGELLCVTFTCMNYILHRSPMLPLRDLDENKQRNQVSNLSRIIPINISGILTFINSVLIVIKQIKEAPFQGLGGQFTCFLFFATVSKDPLTWKCRCVLASLSFPVLSSLCSQL